MPRLGTKTLLKVGDGASPEVFTTVFDVRDITPPGITADTEEITTHSSANFWRKHAATLLDGGEVTAEVLWDPGNATHIALLADLTARTQRNLKILFPANGSGSDEEWSFAGYFTGFQPGAPLDGHETASITIKITDSISFATL